MSFTFLNQLPSPAEIKERFPISKELVELKKQRDAMISDIMSATISAVLQRYRKMSKTVSSSYLAFTQTNLVLLAKDIKESLHSQTLKKSLICLKD